MFDPIQAFLPISSQMKVIYRDLLAACPQMKWDDKIPENFKSRIEAILMQTLSIQDVEINRYLLKGFPQEDRRRLIIFSDGGQLGSVVRIFIGSKIPGPEKKLHAAYMLGKHKLPDLASGGSAPKLELAGVLLASRMARQLAKELADKVDEILIATDSRVILSMINRASAALLPYFSGRVGEVMENVEMAKAKLRFVCGTLNAADVGTKEVGLDILKTNNYWVPHILTKVGLPDLIPVENMEGQVVPKEYIRPNLRVMATHVKSGKFHIRIMTY